MSGSTTDKFVQLLETGPQPYIDAAVIKIKDELIAAGITTPSLVNAATSPTYQNGASLINAYSDLLAWFEKEPAYPGIEFQINNIEVVNGLASLKTEVDLEPTKDSSARLYIDTEVGYELISKAENLVSTLNSINSIIRENGLYNITDLRDFGSFAKYVFPSEGAKAQLQLNLEGIYQFSHKMKSTSCSV